MSYHNKTIFITGGSTGIGLALARQLGQQGAKVAIFARNRDKLHAAKQLINNESPQAPVAVFEVDAQHYDDLKRAFEAAKQELGSPSILINCVGRALPDHFEKIPPKQMEDTLRTNFGSMWNACHIALDMMKTTGGTMVNTSSVGGFVGVFGYSDYSASKFAIIGFSEVLKQELQQYNIKVQVLCPPDTATPGFETENLTKPEETKRISGNAKLMTPEQVAAYTLKAMQGKQFMVIPNFDGRLTYFMKRYFPFIVNKIMDQSIKAVQKGK